MKKIFTILSIAAVAMVSAQTNLVTNPGFESWDPAAGGVPEKPTGWSFISATGAVPETAIVHSGAKSLKHVAPTATGNISTYIDIPAAANTQYSLGFWILDNDPLARARHWVQARLDTSGTGNITWTGTTFQPSTYSTDNPQWVFVTATSTTPAGTVFLRFDFRTYGVSGGGGSIYFDDVQLVQGTLAVTDVNTFDKAVKMNTVVGNELRLTLPARATVNIYSVDGRLISSNRVNDGESINTANMAKGNYIVTVSDGSATVSRKVIKN
ncbi:T9SS type A sorting domain-containing protein [Chryseobacterium koreense]|uniref:Secretion system C-terminal sorting domain-containing protein n=1 Tax=Chryseobacterium koreense CCUG 49689 TaxID=1304281 RepID=A0A0J7J1J7_9FLAO|nr:T9SS type A sorting domain-containing protein [Chryseobacterium koreense]KMQ71934.1 hypothetical protein ACM44_04670 [Chryseobacterium koreense CCUG 49689]MBB5334105.1 hypothetical protein [Chryseobacterium koreense]